jgi:hypothetical protein
MLHRQKHELLPRENYAWMSSNLQRRRHMEIFQQVMNVVFVVLVIAAGGIGFWVFKKGKESGE